MLVAKGVAFDVFKQQRRVARFFANALCSFVKAKLLATKVQNVAKNKIFKETVMKFVCSVCGYVYEGDELPEDIVCPLCKHGASDFEEI